MNECGFCQAPVGSDAETFGPKLIAGVAGAGFATIGDFAKHFGISSANVARLYVSFNSGSPDDVILCSVCADRVHQRQSLRKWWQFWK